MPQDLVLPTVAMTLALAFYSAGVWGERLVRDLRGWHVVAFWLGWACDAYGTLLMDGMRAAGEKPGIVHTGTGASAFLLMGVHAIWATWVLLRGSDEARRGFHRYSVAVWAVWLVPYLGGMLAGIMR